jgi:hypothetical protein
VVFTGMGPTGVSQMPIIAGNEITRGPGGLGGQGGSGGAGGERGLGGPGGIGLDQDENYDFCMVDAGLGGNGQRGGHGGGGAGGAGGVSFDIYVYNANGHDPGYDSPTNDFGLAAGSPTGGSGGQGGNSSNRTTGVGERGPDGESGQVRLTP